MDDLLIQADQIADHDQHHEEHVGAGEAACRTHDSETQNFQDMVATIDDLRDKISNFDDFFRPIRSYFYWERHCFDIPACWSLRSSLTPLTVLTR